MRTRDYWPQYLPGSVISDFQSTTDRSGTGPFVDFGGKRGALMLSAWGGSPIAPNMGDTMAGFLLRKVFPSISLRVPLTRSPKFLSVGSVSKFAGTGDVVWGSGSLSPEDEIIDSPSVYAVRGPRTARLFKNSEVPGVYGDPALLLPTFFEPIVRRVSAVTVVPHYVDYENVMKLLPRDPRVSIVNVARFDWKSAVSQIASSEVVVSSSLHGLIVAEAYGVPTVWVKISDGVRGGSHKFMDYFESTGRSVTRHHFSDDLVALAALAVTPPEIQTHGLAQAAIEIFADFLGPESGAP